MMHSLKNIAIVKTAVAISFHPELKREILCAHRSEFNATKSRHKYCRKEQWNDIIQKKAKEILLGRQGLPKVLVDEVLNLLPAIGLRMLIWAEYHEGALGLTRGYSVKFLSHSHLTREGVVDNVKAAKDLMEFGTLSVKQKYKLACMYCFTDKIDHLYKRIVKEHRRDSVTSASNIKWFQKPDIVKFWTSEKIGRNETYPYVSPPILRMRQAIRSGSKAAVIYSWNAISVSSQRWVLFDAVREILTARRSPNDDWIIFSDSRYDDMKNTWVPTDYTDDILRFIFLKMLELQRQRILQEDVFNYFNQRYVYLLQLSSVLELYLCWPHQEYFMKTAAVLWEFIPEKMYAGLLLKICDCIEPRKYENLQYGEEKCYNYRHILKEFWQESPDHYKRHTFQNVGVDSEHHFDETTTARSLLLKLLSLKKFTREDEGMVKSILDSATDGEREYLLLATGWKKTIVNLMYDEKFEIFDRFLRVCFRSELEVETYKENLNLYVDGRNICKLFFKYKKLNTIESFLNLISVTEHQSECLKCDLIYSPEGKLKCLEILFNDGNEAFEKFIRWFFPTEDSSRAFKRALTFEHSCKVCHLQLDQFYELLRRCASAPEATAQTVGFLQESILDAFGLQICEELICSHSLQAVSKIGDSSLYAKSDFRGGQWEELDKFLAMMPASKVLAFKKVVHEKIGVKILLKLVEARQWAQTEKFFKWLGLSELKIRHLKWKALTTAEGTWFLFHFLVFSDSDDEAKKLERVYEMLKWHLADSNYVLEFRRFFLRSHRRHDEAALNIFTSVVDMYLDELDNEYLENLNASIRKADRVAIRPKKDTPAKGVKRQSSAPATPNKSRKPGVKRTQKKKVTVVSKLRWSQRLLDKAKKKLS